MTHTTAQLYPSGLMCPTECDSKLPSGASSREDPLLPPEHTLPYPEQLLHCPWGGKVLCRVWIPYLLLPVCPKAPPFSISISSKLRTNNFLDQNQPTVSIKGQIVCIFYFMTHMFPVPTSQQCHCGMKAGIDNM